MKDRHNGAFHSCPEIKNKSSLASPLILLSGAGWGFLQHRMSPEPRGCPALPAPLAQCSAVPAGASTPQGRRAHPVPLRARAERGALCGQALASAPLSGFSNHRLLPRTHPGQERGAQVVLRADRHGSTLADGSPQLFLSQCLLPPNTRMFFFNWGLRPGLLYR